MKELDSFTVERLEELARAKMISGHDIADIRALAAIALAAKRAEPWGYEVSGKLFNSIFAAGNYASEMRCDTLALYTTPQLNSQVPLGSWIKCSDCRPEDDDFVLIWPLPDFGVELHVGQYIKYHANGPGWFAQVYEYNYGIEFYPITVTHWMPLPSAPEKPL